MQLNNLNFYFYYCFLKSLNIVNIFYNIIHSIKIDYQKLVHPKIINKIYKLVRFTELLIIKYTSVKL